ncbi:MAG: carboxypeptidase-like regulatory domain-containing protein [bacterium]
MRAISLMLLSLFCMAALATSCETVVAGLLVRELLNDEAPKRKWTGRVVDTKGEAVGGVVVQVRAEVNGDNDLLTFSDETDNSGEYEIGYRWHKDVNYSIRVNYEGQTLAENFEGKIELKDQETDFVLQATLTSEVSGVVSDSEGNPLEGVLVIAASAQSLGGVPSPFLNDLSQPKYVITGDSGIFQIEGAIAKYGIVCAFHPDHGFAYDYDEDHDANGSIALSLKMGNSGNHEVRVQVRDGNDDPIVLQVLDPDRRFRLRLYEPWNLASVIDQVVSQNDIFPGLVGDPSDQHPETVEITVQSTDGGGFAETSEFVRGANYYMQLLRIENDQQATALIQSSNPLALDDDSIVIVRVN